MKYAVKIVETMTRTVFVEAKDYLEAEDKVADAYYNCDIVLDVDNSVPDIELSNDTDFYIKELYGSRERFEEEVETEIE